MWFRGLGVATALAAAVGVAGCASAGGNADPAQLAPGGSAVYLSITIQPEGKVGSDAAMAAAKILGTTHPADRIVQLINRSAASNDPQFSFDKDVKPWLGKRAGLVFTGLQGGGNGVVIVATSDAGKAASALKRTGERTHYTPGSYRGVSYWRDPQKGNLDGVVGDFVVSGDAGGFRRAVDVEKGSAKSLARDDAFRSATSGTGGKLGFAYLDLRSLFGRIASRQPSAAAAFQLLGLGLTNIKPIVATLSADAQAVTIDIKGGQNAGGPFGLHGLSTTSLVGQLPGDTWAAIGISNLGQVLGGIEGFLGANPLLAQGVSTAERRLKRTSGIDIRGDVIPVLGDTAFFVRGTTRATVGGGAVVQIADQSAFARLLRNLPYALRKSHARPAHVGSASGFKLKTKRAPLFLLHQGSRAVITYGPGAAKAALPGPSTLASTPAFAAAANSVGGKPALFFAVAPILDLLRSTGSAGSSGFQKAEPYLARFSYVAAGSPSKSDTRITLGLR
jgi:hypothetical protein